MDWKVSQNTQEGKIEGFKSLGKAGGSYRWDYVGGWEVYKSKVGERGGTLEEEV